MAASAWPISAGSEQAKPEVRDAAGLAGPPRLALEDDHVAAAGRLRLDEILLLVDRDDAEDRLIEGQERWGSRTASATWVRPCVFTGAVRRMMGGF